MMVVAVAGVDVVVVVADMELVWMLKNSVMTLIWF